MVYPPSDGGRQPNSLASDLSEDRESDDQTRVVSDASASTEDSFVTCDEINLDSEPETSAIESPLHRLPSDATQASAEAYSAFDVPPDNGLANRQPQVSVSSQSAARSSGETRQNTYLTKPDSEHVRIFKDYELLEEIGRGGMGVVYKARQRSLNRIVALKMIIAGELATDTAVQRFYREAQSAACLDHPNIVPIHEIGEHEGKHFFSMAFVEGISLADRAKQEPMTPAQAVDIVRTVAQAVHYAHERGIIHRDLKPANILLDRQGRPRITDFGLAKQIGEDSNLTASGSILGTPSYMSPEQATGDAASIGPATDIYSLGGILFRLLTGKPPFQGKSLTETLVQVLHQAPVPARQLKADVPADLEEICLKCLQKDRKLRYATAGELATALSDWLAKNGGADRSVAAGEAGPKGAKPRILKFAGIAAACGLLAFAGTMLLRSGENAGSADAAVPVADSKDYLLTAGPARQDFQLKVNMVGSRDENGERRLKEGEDVKFVLETDRDAYVGVWWIDDKGQIIQLFPNQYDLSHMIKKGEVRSIPTNSELKATASNGKEHVRVIATTTPWNPLEGSEVAGGLAMFESKTDQDKVKSQWRGLTVKLSDDAAAQTAAEKATEVSEVIIPFFVER